MTDVTERLGRIADEHEYPIELRTASLGGRVVALYQTNDFPVTDPWSVLTRKVIKGFAVVGLFAQRDVLEAGVGDGRNLLETGFPDDGGPRKVTGIELDSWRLELAERNLNTVGAPTDRVSLHQGDIVDWLHRSPEQLTGWGFACLPQAPAAETLNDADGYQDLPSLAEAKKLELAERPVDVYGLTLNAAYLLALRRRVKPGSFHALVTLSGRVPSTVLGEMFEQTGWTVAHRQDSGESPIQQDPDTGVAWTTTFDDGYRFFEKNGRRGFIPISAEEAETRRLASLEQHGEAARHHLNVYHGLSVYHLQPEA